MTDLVSLSDIQSQLQLHAETKVDLNAANIALKQLHDVYEADRTASEAVTNDMRGQITRLVQEVSARGDTIAGLQTRLAIATADVHVRVKSDSAFTVKLKQCVNIVNNKHLAAANAAATMRLAANLPTLYKGICVHMSEGFGVVVPWLPNADGSIPPKPTNWSSLTNQLAFIKRTGLPAMMNLYMPPWWMRASGTTKMTAADAYQVRGRLMTSKIPQWQLMVDEGVTVFAKAVLAADPNATIWLDMNNEWKCFYGLLRGDKIIENQRWADGDWQGTPGDVGDMDFPPYARLTIEAALRATDRLSIPRERVKIGGSYPVITFQALNNADSVPVGHPLRDRPYGTLRKVGVNAFDRYLAYFKANGIQIDFLSIDGATANHDLIALTDDFGNCTRFRDVGSLIREIATKYGYGTLELFWKEWYAKPQGRGADNKQLASEADTPQYRGAVKLRALMEMALGGASSVYSWGWEGEGDEPGTDSNGATFVGVDKANGGEATVICEMMCLWDSIFPPGTTAYELEIIGKGVSGLGSEKAMLLLSEQADAQTVDVGAGVVELAGYGWQLVDAHTGLALTNGGI